MALEAGVMSITIEYGKDLKDQDFFGKMDPYCTVAVGDQKFRTHTHHRGGRSPVWNETFSFNVINQNTVYITLYDKDMMVDDLIGIAQISLAQARVKGEDRVLAPVMAASGKQYGFVSVSFRWTPNRSLSSGGGAPPAYSSGGGAPPAYLSAGGAPPAYQQPYAQAQQPHAYAPAPSYHYSPSMPPPGPAYAQQPSLPPAYLQQQSMPAPAYAQQPSMAYPAQQQQQQQSYLPAQQTYPPVGLFQQAAGAEQQAAAGPQFYGQPGKLYPPVPGTGFGTPPPPPNFR